MVRIVFSGLFVGMLFPAAALAAEEPLAIVTGIAAGDLLNVRADASPVGHVEMRLPNGAGVFKSGCNDVNGYEWCKVKVVDRPDVSGWVPARYLLAVDPEGTATASAGDEGSAGAMPPEMGDAGSDVSAPIAEVTPIAVPPENAASSSPPPDLAARFGDGQQNPAAASAEETQAPPPGLSVAEADAYRLAFVTPADATEASSQDADDGAPAADAMAPEDAPAAATDGDAPPVTGDDSAPAAAQDTGVAAEVPVPTARPDQAGETPVAGGSRSASKDAGAPSQALAMSDPQPQGVALANPKVSAGPWDATAEIPCARYIGQPMTRCMAGVKRMGGGKADVTVQWPGGGTRVIGFYDGKPAGADSRGEFRFTREGDLNMIRVGVSERFEITDALAFGD